MKVGWYIYRSAKRNSIEQRETKSVWNLIPQHEFWIRLMKFDLTTRKLIGLYDIRLTVTKTQFLTSITLHCFIQKLLLLSHSLSKDVNLLSKKRQSTIMVTIFWDFLMFDQIILSQLKRGVIFSYKHGIYELPYELPNDLRLKISGN